MGASLSTDRIKLRPWHLDDLGSLVRYANNPNVAANLRDRFPHPYTMTDGRNFISLANQDSPLAHFAIEVQGEAIGGIGLILGEDVFRRSAEVGYWLGEPFWRQGIVTEALSVFTPYAFQAFSLTRLFAGVFDFNAASGRALERNGFTLESTMRKAIVKHNRVSDLLMYAMVR